MDALFYMYMDYSKLFIVFIFSLTVSFLVSPFIIGFLYKFKIWKRKQEIQNIENQAKKRNTPMMGGLIFIVGVIATTVIFNWNRQYTFVPVGVMIMGAALGATDDVISVFGRWRTIATLKDSFRIITRGPLFQKIANILLIPWRLYASIFADFNSSDRKELFPHERFFIYFLMGAVVAWWFYFKIDWPDKNFLWLPFNLGFSIGIFMVPFIIATVFTTTIAVAITDGLDGLLASLSIAAFSGFGVIAIVQGTPAIALFCATMVGALMAYLYFNIKPARIWMGDTGSVALGVTLATVAVLLNRPVLLLVIGFLFFVDFASSFIQVYGYRLFKKRFLPIAPLHHYFETLGWDESKIVIRAMILAWVLAIIGIWLSGT